MSKNTKKGKGDLGRALIKDRSNKTRNRRRVEDTCMLHTMEINDGYEWGRLNLQSVTAESSLTEFLATAELAQREFKAEKLNAKFVSSAPTEVQVETSQRDFSETLLVPRRPKWVEGVTAEEQLAKEKESFLFWRKSLNELQQKMGAALTPYERNLEVWRQLWRTLEKSDVVLILLDARNPLLFRCEDLESYALEENCQIILLLNKADLVSEKQRRYWAYYFRERGMTALFFSAKLSDDLEQIKEEDNKEPEISESDSRTSNSEHETSDSEPETKEDQSEQLKETAFDIASFKERLTVVDAEITNTAKKFTDLNDMLASLVNNINNDMSIDLLLENNYRNEDYVTEDMLKKANRVNFSVLDRTRLMSHIISMEIERKLNSKLVIGMIGYPNVGKSSTVNVLMKTKKVSVSSMPGHTRHVQSLMLTRDVELLDCPGLVLPAYAVEPDLLLTAVLPIDQMRSYDNAMARLCELVPKKVFERKYGLLLPEDESDQPLYKQILTSHAFNRGFMTAAGQPDQSRSARLLLKEAASGVLKWGVIPKGYGLPDYFYDSEEENVDNIIKKKRTPTPRERRAVEGWGTKAEEIDKTFFAKKSSAAHVKGKKMISEQSKSANGLTSTDDVKSRKASKKHANKNKREKLRRVYGYLDQH